MDGDPRLPPHHLRDWLEAHARIFILTGAGCSTGSGIPDYRGPDGAWKRPPPVTYQAFTSERATYQRYWARSFTGWPRFDGARPGPAHVALAALQASGRAPTLVTQNVDGLHQRAGGHEVIDLHGRLDRVVCLACAAALPRASLQSRMADANAAWGPPLAKQAPDGDADVDDAAAAAFVPPFCDQCGGSLKPDVVFFGENVPRRRYEHARDALLAATAMLVAGSSLMVYSGFRFARMAREAGLPLAIVNRGHTRADDLATLRVDAEVGGALAAAVLPPDARR